jgi:hypothetical protein
MRFSKSDIWNWDEELSSVAASILVFVVVVVNDVSVSVVNVNVLLLVVPNAWLGAKAAQFRM